MPEVIPNPPPGFDDLSTAEQIDYLQSLWERIAATPEQVPVPDWHLDVIRERRAASGGGRPWQTVRKEIEQKLRESSSD